MIKALILGIIQGLTEFLPISSSGHLTLFQKILGLEEANFTMNIFLHVATLLPVLFVFKEDIFSLIKKPFQKTTFLLIVATLPTVIMALFFQKTIEKFYTTGGFLGINFIITAFILLWADGQTTTYKSMSQISYKDAGIVGLFEAFSALFPGVSRSGSTICGCLVRKIDRETAAKFSFLLSIPAILGALVLEMKKWIKGEQTMEKLFVSEVLIGCLAAMVTGYFSIRFMLQLIKQKKLSYFSYYLFALGIIVCFDQFWFHWFF